MLMDCLWWGHPSKEMQEGKGKKKEKKRLKISCEKSEKRIMTHQ
jgi:hypothetical protein